MNDVGERLVLLSGRLSTTPYLGNTKQRRLSREDENRPASNAWHSLANQRHITRDRSPTSVVRSHYANGSRFRRMPDFHAAAHPRANAESPTCRLSHSPVTKPALSSLECAWGFRMGRAQFLCESSMSGMEKAGVLYPSILTQLALAPFRTVPWISAVSPGKTVM